MSAKLHFAGAIQIQPCTLDRVPAPCDDSTLELLLASLAHRGSLADLSIARLDLAGRFTTRELGWQASADYDGSLRADLRQLLGDLELEFERLEAAAA